MVLIPWRYMGLFLSIKQLPQLSSPLQSTTTVQSSALYRKPISRSRHHQNFNSIRATPQLSISQIQHTFQLHRSSPQSFLHFWVASFVHAFQSNSRTSLDISFYSHHNVEQQPDSLHHFHSLLLRIDQHRRNCKRLEHRTNSAHQPAAAPICSIPLSDSPGLRSRRPAAGLQPARRATRRALKLFPCEHIAALDHQIPSELM
jgi:hypothetical protein